MFRKFAILAVALTMLFTVGAGQDAQAQCTERDYNGNIVDATGCLAGPGDLSDLLATPTPRPTPEPTSSAVVSADTVEATSTGASGGASIAFTGSESRVLGYTGAGLIGLGAVALIAARRKNDAELG